MIVRSHSITGSSWGDYELFRWLWGHFHYWAIALFVGLTAVIGSIKKALGIEDDGDD